MNNGDPGKSLTGVPGPGHNAWMMTSSALVLFMTLPGLALFYGGLVRKKNVLSVLAQCLGITGLVTILWWAFGYSLVFGSNFNSPYFGGSEYFFLKDVTSAPNTNYAYWVSQNVFSMYQLMFAIITPALIGKVAADGFTVARLPERPRRMVGGGYPAIAVEHEDGTELRDSERRGWLGRKSERRPR